ncbi:hypothetical protein AAF712_011626 [Marasmius tenuissimus]|uniref:Uncharacterized protein n=1 Tax=Marasmius tenuissimus TaxID=585030 RepID=A0ABR2ZKR1_9AGAR
MVRKAEKLLTPAQRAAIEMRNARISPHDESETTSSTEEEASLPKTDKWKAVNRTVQDETPEPMVDRAYETAAQAATENLINRLRDNTDPDINLEAQRNALENFNTVRGNGIQINAVRTGTGEAGGSGSNNREDAVLHPGVPIGNSTNLPDENSREHRKSRRRSRSNRRHYKSKGKHRDNSKSRNKERKAQDLRNPMSSRYEKKLEDAIRGRSRAPENRYASEVAQPINQLPENSLLAKTLGMRNPETERSNKQRRATNKRRGRSPSDPSSSSSNSESSDDDDSSPSESSSESSDSSDDPDYNSSSDETSSSSSGSSSSGESYKQRRQKDKRKAYHRKTSKERRRNKRTIKPIPPPTYDGTPDAERFQNWVMRMIQYLEEGYVPEDEQVMLASNFLRGKALSFFLQKVS